MEPSLPVLLLLLLSLPKKKLRRRLQLWARTGCPLMHTWTDLGTRFWPGTCAWAAATDRARARCRGACLQARALLQPGAAAVALRHQGGGAKVRMDPVNYPVISECKCACPT
ncbi:Noggin-3 [Dissostichus eleginoides]|uniref:Noggin-3 n=1 Tax=Dissostichus eleginoides TaxID=100907 RepID=A0AAD9EUF5_DISEL|nr:Noggin-3 [Dissostichus eleginoides]